VITTIFNLHTYWIINGALAAGYLLARLISWFPFAYRLSQRRQLAFARFCFIFAILSFTLMPLLAALLPVHHEMAPLKPMVHHAAAQFLKKHHTVARQFAVVRSAPFYFSIAFMILLTWVTGFLVSFFAYIKTLATLNKIRLGAYCRHRIHAVSVLFSNRIHTPFCWSGFSQHFIAVPDTLLEKQEDLRLTLRHELQHIRQGDTLWLKAMVLIKLLCFWNPFVSLWTKWFKELQEFACDESLILRRKTSPTQYATCLLNAASAHLPKHVLAVNGLSSSLLYRRIAMLFHYQKEKSKRSFIIACLISLFMIASAAYALSGSPTHSTLSAKEVAAMIKRAGIDNTFQISATPEVVAELNKIRNSRHARKFMLGALKRMKEHKTMVLSEFKKEGIPADFLALPLIESGYEPLDASKNRLGAAGVWQFLPDTARHFGLVVTPERDDRLNTLLETKAAVAYLKSMHQKYGDWNLALISYEIGDEEVDRIIKNAPTLQLHDLAKSSKTYPELKEYVTMFSAAVIIMHYPTLITRHA